jgi:hypothetical protein
MSLSAQIAAIDERTEIGYSYDRYSRGGWRQAIRELLKRGYDEREIEAIMRSKWTRWAADSDDAPYGKTPGVALIRFIDDPRNKCTQAAVAELVGQTFG